MSRFASGRIGAWLAAAAAVLALPLSAQAGHTSDHSLPAYGVNALRAEWLADHAVGLFDLQQMGQENIGLYRARFRQDQALAGGTYSEWTRLDRLTREASLRGVTLVPVLMNMPGESYAPPKTKSARNEFGTFAAAAAKRYGPSGTFWSTCGCPKRPVRVWEVWNEQNMWPYWDAPNPAEYAALLEAVRSKLRKVDRTARIMVGGLAYASSYNTTTKLEPNAFLRHVLEVVGPNGFDALALHSYHSNTETGVNTALAGTVATLKTYGGTESSGSPRHQVWVNEFGRATSNFDDPATATNEALASEEAQRTWLNGFLDRLLPKRSEWNLGPVFWYAIRDSHAATQAAADAWLRLGLRRTNADDTDGGPKLAWDAYTARSRAATEPLHLPVLR